MSAISLLKLPVTRWIAAATASFLFLGLIVLFDLIRPGNSPIPCSLPAFHKPPPSDELHYAVLHYATSSTIPQQSRSEILISFDVLRRRSPCNFLVFGLGRDSPMWSAFNAGGTTVFLEEDAKWFQSVLHDSPFLHAYHLTYPTKLSEADGLLRSYRSQPECLPPLARLSGNHRCRLALADLPAEIYAREWDLIMIDAPKGYFADAPGRMGAIYSAAVMARSRRGDGFTDVFLHDVNRKVEKAFAMEFLCPKYLVGGIGRLWHFRIPSASNNGTISGEGTFC